MCHDRIESLARARDEREAGPNGGSETEPVNIYSRDQYFANLRLKLGKNVQNCMWDNAKASL